MRYTTRMACQLLGRDRKQQADDIATGHCGHVPSAVAGLRYWDQDDLAAELFFMAQRGDGHSVRMAGLTATRVRQAMREYPEADQITLATLENGNRFAMATANLDTSTGWNSGTSIREALIVDVRNLRERVERAVNAYEPEGEEANEAA